jgi:hypothetical protein
MGKPRRKAGNAPAGNTTKKLIVATARADKQEEIESNAESEGENALRESSSDSSASETSSVDENEDLLPPSTSVGQKRKSRAVEETKASELTLQRELSRLNKYFKVIDETALVTVKSSSK